MFFERPKSFLLLWNYIKEIGIYSTFQKVRSRSAEKNRNKRFLGVGLGVVLESDNETSFPVGKPVLFVAPSHSQCVERIVVSEDLILPTTNDLLNRFDNKKFILWKEAKNKICFDNTILGWNSDSGNFLQKNILMSY